MWTHCRGPWGPPQQEGGVWVQRQGRLSESVRVLSPQLPAAIGFPFGERKKDAASSLPLCFLPLNFCLKIGHHHHHNLEGQGGEARAFCCHPTPTPPSPQPPRQGQGGQTGSNSERGPRPQAPGPALFICLCVCLAGATGNLELKGEWDRPRRWMSRLLDRHRGEQGLSRGAGRGRAGKPEV